MNLYKGRPITKERRLDKEVRTYDLLDELDIEYWRVDHEPAMTIEACHDVEKVLGTSICKNLFLCNTQKTNFYLLVMPGQKKFQTKVVSKQLGVARLSFAPEEFLLEYLDITPGSVSIMGLMNDHNKKVRLLVDSDILQDDFFACHPCINTSSIKMSTKAVFDKFLPKINCEATFLTLE